MPCRCVALAGAASGLTITIGAVLTLAILMHITATVKWDEKFGPRRAA